MFNFVERHLVLFSLFIFWNLKPIKLNLYCTVVSILETNFIIKWSKAFLILELKLFIMLNCTTSNIYLYIFMELHKNENVSLSYVTKSTVTIYFVYSTFVLCFELIPGKCIFLCLGLSTLKTERELQKNHENNNNSVHLARYLNTCHNKEKFTLEKEK